MAGAEVPLLEAPRSNIIPDGDGLFNWGRGCGGGDLKVPAWACNKPVADLVRKHHREYEEARQQADLAGQRPREDEEARQQNVQVHPRLLFPGPPLKYTTGPAVMLGFKGFLNLSLLGCTVPIISYYTTNCDPQGGMPDHGIGKSPLWQFLWNVPTFSVLIITMVRAQRLQMQMTQYTLVPQLLLTEDFSFLGLSLNKFPYWVWYAIMSVIAGGCFMDAWTNAEIMGKVVRATQCKNSELEIRWMTTMKHSFIYSERVEQEWYNLAHVMFIAYALLSTQAMAVWLHCVPRYYKDKLEQSWVNYSVDSKDIGSEYPTHGDDSANHEQVLEVLASITRFEAVTFQGVACALERMEGYMQQGRRVSDNWEYHYFKAMHTLLIRANCRFFSVGAMQTVVQTHVQTTLFALTYGINQEIKPLDITGLLFSVEMLILFGIIPDLCDIVELFMKITDGLKRHSIHANESNVEAQEERKKAEFAFCRFTMYALFYVLNFVWVAVLLWKGLRTCSGPGPNGGQLIGTWDMGSGCIEM
mmetsp:Transcript_107351/g.335803  ORF Transcript_107351/g.335803 Transcript_107351/m.335803 type:complete len:528 (+) Transcript_107351:2-1585(+)